MNAEQRQQAITDAVVRDGRVTVVNLAADHGVTVETIRRDLAALDRVGALRKVHGGAVAATRLALPETAVTEREHLAAPAKRAIAAAALSSLLDGGLLAAGATLILDAGTSVGALARILPEGLDLTVVTSSVLTAARLAGRRGLTVRVLGGEVRGITQAAVGPEALAALSRLRVDLAVLGTNGLSADHGLSTPDPDEAAVKTAMVRAARRVVVLADATKTGQEHLVSFADLSDVDLLVTDIPPTTALSTCLTGSGTEVLVA
ncbi:MULTISPECIES: DeoR/GlpR family DNA-binding transcription regulator [Actinomyces]|uniref:Lactose phosphotransferase system repressor n=1 Tax=Actinomyces respiraculi TaxID=2744574 RepID=A0A7T0LK67_9ACTO|nr:MULTISPECIES: DeoR/GlpR family DNA-binding transcription regulator [Actinomyces]QPL05175.1 DeoR/GlpR transcriptional regulator [Actinomyces respiraculi]